MVDPPAVGVSVDDPLHQVREFIGFPDFTVHQISPWCQLLLPADASFGGLDEFEEVCYVFGFGITDFSFGCYASKRRAIRS